MYKKTAQKGIVPIPLIIGGVVAALLVLFIATGSLKFNFWVGKTDKTGTKQQPEPTPTPTSTPTPAPSVSLTPYTNQNLKFSVSYPGDWTMQEDSDKVTFYLGAKGDAKAAMVVVPAPLGSLQGAKLATIADVYKVSVKKEFTNVNFTKDETVMVNGKEGNMLEFTGTLSGKDAYVVYLVTLSDISSYSVAAVLENDQKDKFLETVRASIQTFKLL